MSTFQDFGDVADPSDDLFATVTYGPTEAKDIYCAGAPTDITATDRNGNVLRHRKGVYDAQCRMKELQSLVSPGGTEWATAKFDYWGEGGPVRGPALLYTGPQPLGILRDHLTEAVRAEVPILKALGHR